MKNKIVVYGSYGYNGKLIVDEAKAKGFDVVLAGRKEDALLQQSQQTGFPYQVVDIHDAMSLEKLLQPAIAVIHCAGPFQYTAKAMVDACLKTKTHYTDITGEYGVFELMAGLDQVAKDAGIMIMPGTGFDVVPSDCLAAHLKSRLPSATHLQLAFTATKGGLSRGTAKTMVEGMGSGTTIRKDGRLIQINLGENVMEVDFGTFKSMTLCIAWGDISTAWRSTGIPNIEVYTGATEKMIRTARRSKYMNWLLKQRWVKDYLQKKIDRKPMGPSEEKRAAGKSYLWGKVWDASGKSYVSTTETLSGYTLTAKTAVHIAEKILKGDFKPGYQTPSMAYGKDLIIEIPHSTRKDL
jgi:Uncharacterized conserved protein